MQILPGQIVEILPTKYWVERDMLGASHIMMQHEGLEQPFCYASFYYDYAYTSNSRIHRDVVYMMSRFGIAEADIEWRNREIDMSEDSGVLGTIVDQCATVIQDLVDHRIPASEYPARLRQHFGVPE